MALFSLIANIIKLVVALGKIKTTGEALESKEDDWKELYDKIKELVEEIKG